MMGVGEGGQNGSAPPPPCCADPTLVALPWSVGRLGLGRFGDLGLTGPKARGGGRAPNALGGAVHRRVAGGPELGRCDHFPHEIYGQPKATRRQYSDLESSDPSSTSGTSLTSAEEEGEDNKEEDCQLRGTLRE